MSRHGETAPGTAEGRDPGTRDFVLNQTMLRIRDPDGYWIEILSPSNMRF